MQNKYLVDTTRHSSTPKLGKLSWLSANAAVRAADQIRRFFTSPFEASQGGVREVEVNCGSYSDRRAYKWLRARGFGWQPHI